MKNVRGKVGLTNFGNMLSSVFLYVIVVIVNVVGLHANYSQCVRQREIKTIFLR